jgi:isopenicillin-N N-acyltransferase-like protein
MIERSLDFYRDYLGGRRILVRELPELLAPFRASALAVFPELVSELDGMADGAGVPMWELFAVNAFEEIELSLLAPTGQRFERCTSFAATAAAGAGTLLGHNEQWYAGDSGNVAVIVTRPDRGVPFASATIACCLPAVGINGRGHAQGVMSLAARDERVGVPRVFASRAALEAADPTDAQARATPPNRSGGYAYVCAQRRGGAFAFETTATRHALLEGRPAHTNHYLAPELSAMEAGVSPGSVSRLRRVEQLLESAPVLSIEEAGRILSDHEGDPCAICVHPDPVDGDEAVGVLFSMVCDVDRRRMWVCAGNPCSGSFEEIDVSEAVS